MTKTKKALDEVIESRDFESRGYIDSTCDYLLIQNKSHFQKKRTRSIATPSKDIIGGYEVSQRQNHPRRATIDFRRSRFDGKVSHCRVRDGSMPRRDERRVRAR